VPGCQFQESENAPVNAAAQEYLTARVMTASPQSLHLLVIDGALRHAARAEAALDTGDRATATQALTEARAFVGELIGGIDPSAEPRVASNLAALFTFAYRRLVEADLYGSAGHVRDALKILRLHRETWVELLSRSPSATAARTPETAAAQPRAPHRVASGYEEYQPRSWSG
jgi:flagellar secretion chaperone FliS